MIGCCWVNRYKHMSPYVRLDRSLQAGIFKKAATIADTANQSSSVSLSSLFMVGQKSLCSLLFYSFFKILIAFLFLLFLLSQAVELAQTRSQVCCNATFLTMHSLFLSTRRFFKFHSKNKRLLWSTLPDYSRIVVWTIMHSNGFSNKNRK